MGDEDKFGLVFAVINSTFNETDDEDYEPPPPKRRKVEFKFKNPKPVKTLDELIKILKKNNKKKMFDDLIDSLGELDSMIGLETIKKEITNQILLFSQKMNDPGMFLHTVLTGNPGTGKTTLCHILSRIYKSLGFLHYDKVVVADRSQLVGQYLGETSIKTKKVLEEARGGVLLIDEAYSLGNREGRDSFSKECIDTINQYLSENVDELICVIAGYKKELEECFFSQNRGLLRRFPWKYDIAQYTPQELYEIFIKQSRENSWKMGVPREYLVGMFEKNKDKFENNGGDTRLLLDKCKIVHAQRVFGSKITKKTITKQDIEQGFKSFGGNTPTPPDYTNMLYI